MYDLNSISDISHGMLYQKDGNNVPIDARTKTELLTQLEPEFAYYSRAEKELKKLRERRKEKFDNSRELDNTYVMDVLETLDETIKHFAETSDKLYRMIYNLRWRV